MVGILAPGKNWRFRTLGLRAQGSAIVLQLAMPIFSPYGSKDPNTSFLGPKYYGIVGIGALKPYHLGPWTLTVLNFHKKADLLGMLQSAR